MLKFLGKKLRELFSNKITESSLEKLEEIFYQADLGSQITKELLETVRSLCKKNDSLTIEDIVTEIKKNLINQLNSIAFPTVVEGQPHVIIIVGVNGNGKTTTIAKLANYFQQKDKKVLIAAADTFRAAAIDQLEKWTTTTGTTLVKGKPGSDPAAVVFDSITAAKGRNCDFVLVDTAGRLHTKSDLMKELEKIYRVSGKAHPGAPHETWLVLDATIGQNGVEQAMAFHQATPLTGLILTKLDGSAKGGTALAIQKKLKLPIKYIGTGETIDALQPFEAQSFVNALFA